MTPTPEAYDPKILEYLKKPGNLPLVLQIAHYAAKIREELPREFCSALVEGLNAGRPPLLPADPFTFKPPAVADLAGKDHFSPAPVKPLTGTGRFLYCELEVQNEEEPGEFYVWVGLRWSQPEKKNSPIYKHPDVVELRNTMEADEAGYEFSPAYWLCGRYTWPSGPRERFLTEYAQAGSELIGHAVQSYWRMAERYWPRVEEVNRALRRWKG